MTPAQRLAHDLSHRIIATCARFCDENAIRDRGLDDTQISLVACQVTLLAMLANHHRGEILRLAVAESMVDGTALEYINDVRNQLKGKDPLL